MSSLIEKTLKEGSRLLRDTLFAEKFSNLDAFLQKIDPRVKLLSFLAFITISAISRGVMAPLVLVVLSALLAIVSKIPLRRYIPRTIIFVPIFALVIVLPIPFITPGSVVYEAHVGPLYIVATQEGLYTAAAFTLRVWACVSLAVLLILTTDFSALMKALERMRVPRFFVLTVAVTFRYIFFFLNMIHRTFVAVESRTIKKARLTRIWRSMGFNVGALFIRSYEEGEKVYMAMRSRGYAGEIKTMSTMKCRKTDLAFTLTSIAFCAAILLIEYGFPIAW